MAAASTLPTNPERHVLEPAVVVDGIPLFDGTAHEAIEACLRRIESEQGGRVATANLDFFALARRDQALKDHLRRSSLVLADGAPVAWIARVRGARAVQRCAGVDLVRELCATGLRHRPLRVAVYGSSPEIGAAALPAIESLGGAQIVAAIHPPFRPATAAEEASYRDELRASRPDVVLVALGCPVQERVIAEWYEDLPQALWIGIGGTLDFFGGVRRRAPGALQRAGLEWLVRLGQEPRRLAKRYLVRDMPLLPLMLLSAAYQRALR